METEICGERVMLLTVCSIGGFISTLSVAPESGGQGAIMARRIQDDIDMGCRWFTTETGEDKPEAPNSSYHNMIRTGFQLVYLRPTYVYKPNTAVSGL